MRIESRLAFTALMAALLGTFPAFAQTTSQVTSGDDQSATASKPADPDAPPANSVDGTGTFSVNPPLASDPGLGGVKAGPSRTDMNAETDAAATAASSPSRPDSQADLNASDTGQRPASPR